MTLDIPFGRPILGDEERALVAEVLSGSVLTHGPKCAEFERRFADLIGVKHAITTSNCTTALHLSLLAHDIGPGDEVVMPAMTHVATAHSVEHSGAKPVFVDVDPVTGNIDPARIEAVVTNRTKIVLVVHYLGLPADMDVITATAASCGLSVIEDCATALCASFDGRKAGTIGAAGCFSFYPVKHITTMEGGMLTTDDDEIADRVKKAKAFGYDKNLGERSLPGIYDIASLGYNFRMSEGQAAVGMAQLDRVEGFLAARKRNAETLMAIIAEIDQLHLFPLSHGSAQSSWYCVNITLKEGAQTDRNDLIRRLNADGIGTSVHYPVALPMSRYYSKRYGYRPGDFPVAEWIANATISLPCGPHLAEGDAERIGMAVTRALA